MVTDVKIKSHLLTYLLKL